MRPAKMEISKAPNHPGRPSRRKNESMHSDSHQLTTLYHSSQDGIVCLIEDHEISKIQIQKLEFKFNKSIFCHMHSTTFQPVGLHQLVCMCVCVCVCVVIDRNKIHTDDIHACVMFGLATASPGTEVSSSCFCHIILKSSMNIICDIVLKLSVNIKWACNVVQTTTMGTVPMP